jgi:hypothetical protein
MTLAARSNFSAQISGGYFCGQSPIQELLAHLESGVVALGEAYGGSTLSYGSYAKSVEKNELARLDRR